MTSFGRSPDLAADVVLRSEDERGAHSGGTYRRQLDTLRAVAVGLVIVSHWAPEIRIPGLSGLLGVRLFFVISGFLITGILLDARHDAATLGTSRRRVLGSFYARRALRILPVFYATLAVTWALGFPNVRDTLLWHVFYASNILFSLRADWLGEVSHFWSLAVEEQFYLVWPLFVMFLPRRVLPWFMGASIAAAFVFRIVGTAVLHLNPVALVALPLASLDMLAAGGLCAYLQRTEWQKRLEAPARWTAVVGFLSWIALRVVSDSESLAFTTMRDLVRVAMLAAAVLVAWYGVAGPLGRLLSLRWVVYVGRISYSLYLFHIFVPLLTRRVVPPMHPILTFGMNLAVLLAVSSLSWRFFEAPVNSLKRHFPYVRGPAAAVSETYPGAGGNDRMSSSC
jgi:peptidoglycan/LPS O-acetylase OafA/YrhL